MKYWKPISEADKKDRILCESGSIIYSARYRFGELGEPSQDTEAWRADCCGRFAGSKVKFMPYIQVPE